ncbi:helix-turn-helix transcriptional regulator [Thermobifida halotolerans]|uniref:Helix-turn-helix transcriptional regulator n=1 Tax=Thermobifida halotolerans TaxID=483545 RepID=A0AA97LZ81_9ACTN|nr:helix-turn-helix transcriptional regulator [Thermobifida halotolerans]UOE21072.1 helix-turn-helix transcriptional regulator [Thermobifida halotolerans]
MPQPLITRAALKAAITARELNPNHPVFPTEFWTHPVVARAVARLDTTTLIRQARTLTPITQEQLAHLTGLTQATISRIEHGRTQLRDLDRIHALLTGLGAPHPPSLKGTDPLDGYTVRAVIADNPDGHTVVLHAPTQTVAQALTHTGKPVATPLPPPPTHPEWPPPR